MAQPPQFSTYGQIVWAVFFTTAYVKLSSPFPICLNNQQNKMTIFYFMRNDLLFIVSCVRAIKVDTFLLEFQVHKKVNVSFSLL